MTHILIVEDDRETSFILRHILNRAGYRFEAAATAREGFALALANPPSLAIVDLRLPEIDGLTLIQEIKSHPQLCETRIIILTCDDTAETKQRAEELGCNLFLEKPFFYDQLLENINRILGEAKACL